MPDYPIGDGAPVEPGYVVQGSSDSGQTPTPPDRAPIVKTAPSGRPSLTLPATYNVAPGPQEVVDPADRPVIVRVAPASGGANRLYWGVGLGAGAVLAGYAIERTQGPQTVQAALSGATNGIGAAAASGVDAAIAGLTGTNPKEIQTVTLIAGLGLLTALGVWAYHKAKGGSA